MKTPFAPAWRFRLQRLGWPTGVGVLCVLIAVAMGPWVNDPLRAQAREWNEQAWQARLAQSRQSGLAEREARDPTTAFVAELPAGDAALAAVQDLHQLARQHGVQLASGEYRLIAETGQRWQRYQITLPAQADDLALRRWMADALNRWPSLALDDWSFSREQSTQDTLQARVRWSFYLKSPS